MISEALALWIIPCHLSVQGVEHANSKQQPAPEIWEHNLASQELENMTLKYTSRRGTNTNWPATRSLG
jgi:hypothetical protein